MFKFESTWVHSEGDSGIVWTVIGVAEKYVREVMELYKSHKT